MADLQRASGTYAEDGTWDDRAFYRRTGPGADFVLFRTAVPFQLDVGCVAAGTWLLSDSVSWDAPAAIAEGDGIFKPIRGWQHAQSGASMLISVRPVRGSVAATVVAKQEPKSVEEPEVEEANADDCDEADVEQDSPLEEVEQLEVEEAEVEQDSPLEEDGVEQDSPLEEEEAEVEQDSPLEEAEVEQDSLGVGGAKQEPFSSSYRRLNLDKAQQAIDNDPGRRVRGRIVDPGRRVRGATMTRSTRVPRRRRRGRRRGGGEGTTPSKMRHSGKSARRWVWGTPSCGKEGAGG